MSRGTLYILSAPAGTGKTTLVRLAVERVPNLIQSISYTTRDRRPGEIPGVDYFFVSRREFQERALHGRFLESVEIYGDFYGTDRQWVEEHLQKGFDVVLVIDIKGAACVQKAMEAKMIFVSPPSLEELRKRLIDRGTETKESLKKRLERVEEEMKAASHYQYRVVNADINTAVKELVTIFTKGEDRGKEKSTYI